MIEKVKDGHPLSKAEWATIMAAPGSFLVVGYYALKVTENTANTVIKEIKSQYHAMLEGLWLRKDATPDEFPVAVAKHETPHIAGGHDDHDDHATPPEHTPSGHTATAANDDHVHQGEHPGEHAHAA